MYKNEKKQCFSKTGIKLSNLPTCTNAPHSQTLQTCNIHPSMTMLNHRTLLFFFRIFSSSFQFLPNSSLIFCSKIPGFLLGSGTYNLFNTYSNPISALLAFFLNLPAPNEAISLENPGTLELIHDSLLQKVALESSVLGEYVHFSIMD